MKKPTKAPRKSAKPSNVTLQKAMIAHKSKGKTFEDVIPTLNSGSQHSPPSIEDNPTRQYGTPTSVPQHALKSAAEGDKRATLAEKIAAKNEASGPKSKLKPTAEQQVVIDNVVGGFKVLVLIAGAGAGKTSTLRMVADNMPGNGQYTAFNNSLVADSASKFQGTTVACNTTHSLAFRAIGAKYAHRLGGQRIKSDRVAGILDIKEFVCQLPPVDDKPVTKRLPPGLLASFVMGSIKKFCQSADKELAANHFRYVDGIDYPPGTVANNEKLQQYLLPFARKAWADICDTQGQLPFAHDCQPPGTMVRQVTKYGGGVSGEGEYEDVPIEKITEGDRVVSYSLNQRRGYVRRAGRTVTKVGSRPYNGQLVVVSTGTGLKSSYTTGHKCIARLDCDLTDGNYVVYLAQRGDQFRIGRTTWRTKSQGNSLGIRRRADCMDIDAIWVLSVHRENREAALAEAITAHKFNIPTLQFPWKRMFKKIQITPLEEFWKSVGDNQATAVACLEQFGRRIGYPMFDRETHWKNTRRPLIIRAANLLSGMLVLDVDSIKPSTHGALQAYDGAGGWQPISVNRVDYKGPAYNLEVEEDHTYIADGIATHNCYVKIWQLNNPVIASDYILLDEAQDTAPVMLDILQQQTCPIILVGDPAQQIYEWRGAVDAMAAFPDSDRCTLTQSFRFGQKIADVANAILKTFDKPTELRLRGLETLDSKVEKIEEPTAILCRTNAVAISSMLNALALGKKPFLVGGTADVISFVRACQDLQQGKSTSHPELACFDSWQEVQEYVKTDDGGDLKLMVKLITAFGCKTIIDALQSMPEENDADIIISTAHKSKGRQWAKVRVASDFPTASQSTDSDRKLLYVTCTRAEQVLDITSCPFFTGNDAIDLLGADGKVAAPLAAEVAPTQYTWSKSKDGKDEWLVRGPKGMTGKSVEIVSKAGKKAWRRLGQEVWSNDVAATYRVS